MGSITKIMTWCSAWKMVDLRTLSKRFKKLFHKTRPPGYACQKVQDILGHESIRTTLDVYDHVLQSMQRDAVDRLNNFMGQ